MFIFYIVHPYSASEEEGRVRNLESVQAWAERLVQTAADANEPAAVVPWWEGIDPSRPDRGRARSAGIGRGLAALEDLAAIGRAAPNRVTVCTVVAPHPISAGMRREIEAAIALGLPVYPAEDVIHVIRNLNPSGGRQ